MNRKRNRWVASTLLLCSMMVLPAFAGTLGPLTYEISTNEVTITSCDPSASGSLTIPNTIEGYPVTAIGAYSFQGRFLTSIITGNNVTTIGESAFRSSFNLTSVTVGNSVTNIGYRAFLECYKLTSVSFGSSLKTIGDASFTGCIALTSVVIPASVTHIGNFAFSSCNLSSVVIPASVTHIGNFAFRSCNLSSVVIPASVTHIGYAPFNNCRNLTAINVDANNATYCADSGTLFNKNKTTLIQSPAAKIGSYSIPASVTSIGDYAFYYSGLTIGTIPNRVIDIGRNAFSLCNGLTSMTIPDSVTNIGDDAFLGCSGLTNVIIGNSVLNIGDGAFKHCDITNVTIPDSVNNIGDGAFDGCDELASVQIGSSVTNIGDSAFAFCDLTNVMIPDSVTNIGDDAFKSCDLTSLVIGNSVTHIGKEVFYNCTGLTSVTLPESLIHLGESAFLGCSGLISVTIPDRVTSIERAAFNSCTGLMSVMIGNSVTNIGVYAFYRCTGLTSVTIPAGVKTIDASAFKDCNGLTSMTIPDNVISIGDNAFNGCTGLSNLTIHDGLTSIGEQAFLGCSGLTSVMIPDSVTSIERAAFHSCTGLMNVTVGNSVTNIGDGAFYECNSLQYVTFEGNAPDTFDPLAFKSAGSGFTIYFYAGMTGFTTPTWNGYSCEVRPAFKFIVNFNTGAHGSIVSGHLSQEVFQGASAVAPSIAAEDYWHFAGWDRAFDSVTSNITVTAQYVEKRLVTFDAGEHGAISSGTAVQYVVPGGNAAAPTIDPDTHWSFTGWDGSYASVSSDITLTAQYQFEMPGVRFARPSNYFTNAPSFVTVWFRLTDEAGEGVDIPSALVEAPDFFTVEENDSPISTSESSLQVSKMQGISDAQMQTVLMLDNSFSVASNLPNIKASAKMIVSNAVENQVFALYSFSGPITLLQDYTADKEALYTAIDSIVPISPSTDLYGAILEGLTRMDDVFNRYSVRRSSLVVLTDGDDTANQHTLSEVLAARGDKQLFAVGLGTNVDEAKMLQLGNTNNYYNAETIDDLDDVFSEIQRRMVNDANSFYWLQYLSPTRGDNVQWLNISVANNNYTGTNSSLNVFFNCDGFSDATPSVMVNRSIFYPEGIETITLDGADPFSATPFTMLQAVAPGYIWSVADETIAQVVSNASGAVSIEPLKNGATSLTLIDQLNYDALGGYYAYSVTLSVVVTSFPSDRDVDLMPDDWEQQIVDASGGLFTDVNQVNPGDDFDGDGQSNLEEYISGMDPTDVDAVFEVKENGPVPSGYVLSWPAVAGRVYGVFWSTNLITGFDPLVTGLLFPQNSYTDTIHSAEGSGMYKVNVQLAE